MNFLAHCLLAARADDTHEPYLVAGGILGDFWKGTVPISWPLTLQTGVRLHRRIDALSNTHPVVRQSCARFPAELRRLAPILVDIHADLALALHWQHHCADPLEAFAQTCYVSISGLNHAPPDLPEDLSRFIRYMRQRDLLCRYGTWEGVELCIEGISRRLGKTDFTAPALAACQSLSESLTDDFQEYFPDLQSGAAEFVRAAR